MKTLIHGSCGRETICLGPCHPLQKALKLTNSAISIPHAQHNRTTLVTIFFGINKSQISERNGAAADRPFICFAEQAKKHKI